MSQDSFVMLNANNPLPAISLLKLFKLVLHLLSSFSSTAFQIPEKQGKKRDTQTFVSLDPPPLCM